MSADEFIFPDAALVPRERIATMLVQIAVLQSALAARLITDTGNGIQSEPISHEPEEFLTASQTAELLSVSIDWIYHHASELPYTKRPSRKALRFSRADLLMWRAGQRA